MTAKETLNRQKRRGIHDFYYEDEDIIIAMKEYAKEKCQELLLLVAEKAEVKQTVYFSGEDNTFIEKVLYTESDGHFKVDTDSILNAVNLDEFIK